MNDEMSRNISSRNGYGTTQACAACRFQRRKCGPNCIFAPYFPHDRQKQFLNAHRLFGVGKITNMIKDVDPSLRDVTMSTIIYQSEMRALDPVGGCYSFIRQLQSKIEYLSAELHLALQQLANLRASSSSSASHLQLSQQAQLLNHHNYHHMHDMFNNNNNDMNAMILHHGGSSLHAPHAAHSHYQYHYVDVDEQQDLPNVVDPSLEDILSTNYEALRRELHKWGNFTPMTLPLTLEDKKEEQHDHVDHHHQNDEKPVLDLINDVNSDATRTIHPDHQE